MKLNKFMLVVAASMTGIALNAGPSLEMKTNTDFAEFKLVTCKENIFSVKGSVTCSSVKSLPVDPAKIYRLSAQFKLAAGTAPRIYFGFIPLDKDGKRINPGTVEVNRNSYTTLVKDVKKGDTVLSVKNWSGNANGYVALDAKLNYSDLPNRKLYRIAANGVSKKGDVWEIKLQKALTEDFKAGTGVRQHYDSAAFMYCRIFSPQKIWTPVKCNITKTVPLGISQNHFWPGTKSVKILILILGAKPDTIVEFKNLKVEQIELE